MLIRRIFAPIFIVALVPRVSAQTVPTAVTDPRVQAAAHRLQPLSLFDSAYGRARRLWIYTPTDYDSQRPQPYPLVVAFDGAEYQDTIPLPLILDTLRAAGKAPPVVAVLIDDSAGAVRIADLGNAPRMVEFLARQLVPHVRAHWHVTTDPRRVLVTGSSAGGLAAAYVALQRPDLFGNVLSQSGAFWRGEAGSNAAPYEWLTAEVARLPRRDVRFLLDVGALEDHATLGGAGPNFLAATRRFRAALTGRGYPVTYTEVPGGQHAPQYWSARLPQGLVALTSDWLDAQPAAEPKHLVFFGRDRERIAERTFLENENIAGAQLVYTWRELEPERDRYRLQPLLADLAFLQQHGKRLFVQLQDVSFSEAVPVPAYLLADPAFGGGAARKYEGDDGSQPPRFDGWVARRWDPAVRARFAKLLDTLGNAVDGRIEGINLPETAIGFGESGKLNPAGFSYESYLEGVKENMSAARRAFPRSRVIEYANFMPGEWLPDTDRGYLRAVYAHAATIGVGVGGPDVLPHRPGQQHHSYPLIAARDPAVPAGIAVQDGNLEARNPDTGALVTVGELYDFATNRLRVDYIFWGTQEPYYTRDVLPFLRDLKVRTPQGSVR